MYPAEALRRRFITESWRNASIRHGFEEVDGPTFEHLELYTVKSGEGIVSELFSFQRSGGEKTFALRPEFTPTLARLYASKAASLPRPTKWFMCGPFFRAERPQRGRLREFLQWNADMLGDDSPRADAEIIATCVSMLSALGLTSKDVRIRVNHRSALAKWLVGRGVGEERHAELFKLLDAKGKMSPAEFAAKLAAFGFSVEQAEVFQKGIVRVSVDETTGAGEPTGDVLDLTLFADAVIPLAQEFVQAGIIEWIDFDLSIVRGLAYYTGMVFEAHEATGAERAIAGGGRYDNLVEMFGGPPTPAVGFGMGDVVLGLVLEERGLMPSAQDLARKTGALPDVFIVSSGQPGSDQWVRPLCAKLRGAGLHARHTYKTTKNVGKLMQEASASGAKFAVIIESGEEASIKDVQTGVQDAAKVRIEAVPGVLLARLGRG